MARTVATLQRRSAQELIDKRISLAWPSPDVVDDELVPVGEAPGRFEGFATSSAALTVARRSPEVCMVLRDADGRYHVLRTTARSLGDKYAAPEDPAGWKIIEIVEPTKRATDDEFRREYETARDAPAAAQAEAYRRLLVAGTHLDYDETAWSPDKARMFPGKINVALWLPSRGRHEPAEVVPTGSAELPATTILIGNTPFADGPDSLRSTLLHESRHAYHMAETLDLIRKWRQTRQGGQLAVVAVVAEVASQVGPRRGVPDDLGRRPIPTTARRPQRHTATSISSCIGSAATRRHPPIPPTWTSRRRRCCMAGCSR